MEISVIYIFSYPWQEASELVRKAALEDLFLPEQDKPDINALGIIASLEEATQPSCK